MTATTTIIITTIMTIRNCPRPNCACVALETILTEKGYVDPAALDLLIETYETKVGPRNRRPRGGACLGDAGYRARCSRMRRPRYQKLGYAGRQASTSWRWKTLPALHNMVVARCVPVILGRCSGCAGLYKSAPYRSKQ